MNWTTLVQALSDAIRRQADELNALDSLLGDGDHGTSLAAGFAEAAKRVESLGATAPNEVLKVVGSALLNTMGGSSGALYGSLFLRAGMAAAPEGARTVDDIARMLQAGLEAVTQRGNARPGDKTMVDALDPAVAALRDAAQRGLTVEDALAEAAQAARRGADGTAAMVARHGRAKYVGERAVGHRDAGAVSVAILFDTLARWWKENAHA